MPKTHDIRPRIAVELQPKIQAIMLATGTKSTNAAINLLISGGTDLFLSQWGRPAAPTEQLRFPSGNPQPPTNPKSTDFSKPLEL